MPIPASPLLTAEVARTVTTPGYLVEINFLAEPAYYFRACSRDTVTFRGATFLNFGFDLEGLSPSVGQAAVRGSIVLRDPDWTAAVPILQWGIEGKPIRIWAYYGDVPTLTAVDMWSPIELFVGVAKDCSIDAANGRINISLASVAWSTNFSPRLRITKANGFNWLPARGTVIDFGGERFEIQPE